ncbi:MAG: pyridoxal-phosphate dependent enzyme [Acidobacteriota bacterium]
MASDFAPSSLSVTLADIREAGERIRGIVLRSPLIPLRLGGPGPDIYLKLESLQPINAFKLRGAANAVAMLSESERSRGVWTISAGNAGQGVAYAARSAGVPCTVVVIENAPETKVRRMRELGATLVKAPFDACWRAMETRSFEGVEGAFIHPFDDSNFIAGNGTIALEIEEDLPSVRSVVAAVGGGGLISGIGSAFRELHPEVRIYGAEPETAAPLSRSLETGKAEIFTGWTASFVDGAGGKSVFPNMWDRLRRVVDASIVVSLDEVRRAMRHLAEEVRIISEGAGALAVAAAMSGRIEAGPIVAVVSGGNVDLEKFCELIAVD